MRSAISCLLGFIVLTVCGATATANSINAEQIDSSKIYYGSASAFESAAEVDTDRAIKATPEYKEIRDSKIGNGTGKYWILLSQATDRVHQAIEAVASQSNYDLIAEKGYLASCDPPVGAIDITAEVIAQFN